MTFDQSLFHLEGVESDRVRLSSECSQQQSRIADLEQQLLSARSQAASSELEARARQAEAQLQRVLADMRRLQGEHLQQRDEGQTRLEEAQSHLAQAQTQVAHVRGQVAQAQAEAVRQKEEHAKERGALEGQLEAQRARLAETERRLAESNERMQHLQAQLAKLEVERADAQHAKQTLVGRSSPCSSLNYMGFLARADDLFLICLSVQVDELSQRLSALQTRWESFTLTQQRERAALESKLKKSTCKFRLSVLIHVWDSLRYSLLMNLGFDFFFSGEEQNSTDRKRIDAFLLRLESLEKDNGVLSQVNQSLQQELVRNNMVFLSPIRR